ncbi:hypothetical protein FKP32DRAFT_1604617 [Trametes sanguinea]|nr:hypothetical protein FKP32DRAFT_1604617 [Trametes sanguinea]
MSSEAVASLAISGQSAFIAACFQLTATRLTPVNSVSAKSCTVFAWIALVVQCLNLLSLAALAFSAMRTYVLARRERWITCLTLALGLLALTGTLVTVFQSDSVKLSSPMHCTTDAPRPPPPLLIVVTWKKTFRVIRITRELVQRPTLSFVMLESGILYFIILFIVHMLQLTFQLAHITTTESASFVSASVLICHFILSLRAVNEQQDAHMSYTANTELTYPIFTSNAGSSVQYPLTLLSTSAESEHDYLLGAPARTSPGTVMGHCQWFSHAMSTPPKLRLPPSHIAFRESAGRTFDPPTAHGY